MVALKRAREQLLDPITVLRGVAQDELAVLQETTAANTTSGGLDLGPDKTTRTPVEKPDGKAPAKPEAQVLPAWLEPKAIGERQAGLRDRLEEVRARLEAATAPRPPKADAKPDAKPEPAPDPKQAKLLERIKAALPSVVEASTEMDQARQALEQRTLATAIEHERAALLALSRAIEQFADLKQTIELAYGEQQRLVALLSPEGEKLPAAERAKETHDGLARNVARVTRLAELLADEVAELATKEQELAAKAGAAGPAPAGPGAGSGAPDPKQLDAAKQQLAQAKDRLTHAEELRKQAAAKLDELDKALAAAKEPAVPAKEAEAKLEELRKLFFSVIEHLQQLIRDQGETRDQTSAANGEDDFSRAPKLPGMIGRQEGHGQMAKAITDALAAQADAASKQQGQPQQGAPDPKSLAGAADEVRLAQSDMGEATRTLTKARDAKQTSESLAPAMKSQGTAIEHLEAALRLLQPPQKQDQKQDQQKQDQQKQDQQKQDQQKQDQQKQGGAGQRARDEDAKRQKERRQKQNASDPVEKDW